jgi:cell division protein FtsL
MDKMGRIQKGLFVIFAILILSLGVYIVHFSLQNRELIDRNYKQTLKNDSLNREAIKNDSIIINYLIKKK